MTVSPSSSRCGFTLVESMMATVSVGVVGLSIFYTLYYGLLLFTKNTAMNVSHQEARMALLQLDSDIHSAVSPPSLTDSNGIMISATSGGAGVEFQVLVSSSEYCELSGSAAAGQNVVTVGLPPGYPAPAAGMRLIIPAFEVEQNVISASVSGTLANCTLANSLTNALDGASSNVICFFTQRIYYYISGQPGSSGSGAGTPLTLNYIGLNRTATYGITSSELATATPFSIPSTSTGAANYHSVVISGLSTEDPQTTNLGSILQFNTSGVTVSGQVPEYSTLTTYQ